MAQNIAESPQVAWMLETKIKPGQRPALEQLIQECATATRADPKAMNYEFYMNGDALHIFEKYADSPATMAHLQWFAEKVASRFLGMVDITRFTVYGAPSTDVRKALAPMGATYLESHAGFAR